MNCSRLLLPISSSDINLVSTPTEVDKRQESQHPSNLDKYATGCHATRGNMHARWSTFEERPKTEKGRRRRRRRRVAKMRWGAVHSNLRLFWGPGRRLREQCGESGGAAFMGRETFQTRRPARLWGLLFRQVKFRGPPLMVGGLSLGIGTKASTWL